jgi:NTE family protein
MNQNHRDTLASCLTQIFGRVEDEFVDAALPMLDWIELTGGETLMSEGDAPSGVYFVISGRMRAFVSNGGTLQAIGEIGRGETVGEMGVLTGEPRAATVIAIRDTVLAYAKREVFDALWHKHPQLPVHMAKIIIERLKRSATRKPPRKPATIALMAITDGVDLRALGDDLVQALDRWGVATIETSERINERFGPGAADITEKESETHHRVTTWLDDVEFWNEFVLLLTDEQDTEWTRRCLRHADEILLVARADAPVQLGEREAQLCMGEDRVTGARQTLLLLHGKDVTHPTGTAAWLDRRPIDAHFHVRPWFQKDIDRLARIISRNAIGLVLAGGGARGFAHLGVVKALEEEGIEIDFVGGTSIGAAMAAYVSWGHSSDMMIALARKTFGSNPTGDLNFLPMLSLIKGGRLRKTIAKGMVAAIGREADVVDSWRTLYCVASNYTTAQEVVITRGKIDRAVRASVSIPVALPPVLWEGELLIDGGVFNNFPTDVMARMGARRIIGVDLARRSAKKFDFEEVPSTWQLLLDKLRPRKKRRYRLPTLGSVLMGVTILYSESRREQAKQSVDIYLNPELAGIGLLDWKGFDRIVKLGYAGAKDVLSKMSPEELEPYRNVVIAGEEKTAAVS